jgi:hypothetical protein
MCEVVLERAKKRNPETMGILVLGTRSKGNSLGGQNGKIYKGIFSLLNKN